MIFLFNRYYEGMADKLGFNFGSYSKSLIFTYRLANERYYFRIRFPWHPSKPKIIFEHEIW